MMKSLVGIMWIVLVLISGCSGNPDAKRLYDDLLSNYNKLVRPVVNVTDALTVKIKLKLSQLIDVNLKNQIMTTNLWVEQSWYDYKLKWDPKEYGGVEMLHVPSDHIWRPDIVLYNNADGNFEVTLATKATLNYTGRVEWKPPAIYKSSCEIDVEYFPFDEQTCVMKFGSWTYDGFQVDLRHIDEIRGSNVVDIGVDLSEFYTSVEWDILEVPAVRPQYQIDKRSMSGHHGQRVMVRTCNGLELRDPSLFVETSASELVESSVLFPSLDSRDELHPRELEAVNLGSACRIHGSPAATAAPPPQLPTEESVDALCNTLHHWHHCPELYKAIEGIRFIADHTKREEDSTRVKEDWKYVAMVLDRLFLWIFFLAVVVGTAGIILQAPTLYDDRIPIDVRLSEIASTTAKPHIVTSL
ncbi:nicotinic acetylcholine receptor alpha3 subunit isoform X4 [Megachile rotundata]|uniref:nicotinic acetylcholine receptor alpha3 subunit isoform X4 n=1 Tax=Megachile rotundata TaxID=143995 RepID=UPI000614CD6E|nr:PREDICTED: acetylcholine receptor subunit alpha-like isoform X3 [Megachile rotundata]